MFDNETSRIYRIQFYNWGDGDDLGAFILNDELEWWCQLVKSLLHVLREHGIDYVASDNIQFYQNMSPYSRRYYPYKLDVKDPQTGEYRPFILIENQPEDDDD